jgi:glutaredoxin
MFLIYGTTDCMFCHRAKVLLTDSGLPFTYVDLNDMYFPPEDWRQVFKDLAHLINGQTKIPLIFKSAPGCSPVGRGSNLTGWTFVGGYFDLEDLLDNMDLSLDLKK